MEMSGREVVNLIDKLEAEGLSPEAEAKAPAFLCLNIPCYSVNTIVDRPLKSPLFHIYENHIYKMSSFILHFRHISCDCFFLPYTINLTQVGLLLSVTHNLIFILLQNSSRLSLSKHPIHS